MMNNKGFTLVEVLVVVVIISLVLFVILRTFGTTFSFSKEEAYDIMKNNIVSVSYDYVNECNAGTVSCDFDFDVNNRFYASVLEKYGYFHSLKSPIDGKNLGNCLIIEVTKNNGVVMVDLIDNCY